MSLIICGHFFGLLHFPPKWNEVSGYLVLGWISDLPIGCQLTSSLSYEDQSWAADNWSTRNSDSYGRFVTIAFSWSNICRICKSQSYVTRHVNRHSSCRVGKLIPIKKISLVWDGNFKFGLIKSSVTGLNFWYF